MESVVTITMTISLTVHNISVQQEHFKLPEESILEIREMRLGWEETLTLERSDRGPGANCTVGSNNVLAYLHNPSGALGAFSLTTNGLTSGTYFFAASGSTTTVPLSITSTLDTISNTTGALQVTGWYFNQQSPFRWVINYAGSTAGTATIVIPASVANYTLTLPNSLPTTNGYALVSDTTGNLSFAPGGRASFHRLKLFQAIFIPTNYFIRKR